MPQFSICIPAYKSRFLEECIQSILQQSVTDFELIVLNDCSPQPVRQIVTRFADARIRYFENERNTGAVRLTDNWNKCLSLAKGTYLVIMGDDDRLAPDYLEEFIQLIATYPQLDVYHCRSVIINEEGNPIMLTPACPAYERVCDHIWHRLRQLRAQYISDFVYRTEALRRQGGFYSLPLAWGSDDITAYRASVEKGIAHTNKPVFNYRSNDLSITSSGSDLEKMQANTEYAQWLSNFLQNHHPHPSEIVVYQTLLTQQSGLMQDRKLYTLALSMRQRVMYKFWMWFRNRKRFGLTVKDLLLAAAKSRRQRKHE